MNLIYYTERQKELDANLETKSTPEKLQMAIIAELGELANELKYGSEGWCWWPRVGKERSRERITGELIDLLHFILVGYNMQRSVVQEYDQAILDDVRSAFAGFHEPNGSINNLSHELLHQTLMGRYHLAISIWYQIAITLNFSDDDIEKAYEQSYQKNVSRWT